MGRLFVIRRDCEETYRAFQAYFAGSDVRVVWDRRTGERRERGSRVARECRRRRRDRRRVPPRSWETMGYVFVDEDTPASGADR